MSSIGSVALMNDGATKVNPQPELISAYSFSSKDKSDSCTYPQLICGIVHARNCTPSKCQVLLPGGLPSDGTHEHPASERRGERKSVPKPPPDPNGRAA
jgi:hypothetical protein